MTGKKPLLLIPVENQVRELEPKLLLACIAAKRGFCSVIGSRRELEFRVDSFPRSIYLSKSMTKRSVLFFRIARKFGHEIVTWDEEALVHLPPDIYFSRRLHPEAIKHVSHLFAWGPDNVDLWRKYPYLPVDLPIHSTGNPRGDMLRPQLHAFYEEEVELLERTYGNFILINTNFNHVNAFGADMNLFQPVKTPGETPKFGRAARGMTRDYAEGLRDHKNAVFESFQRFIPQLEEAFPDYTIVVRPHPTERHDVYHQMASRCRRVKVTNEGNVVPWLLATRALIHNGCTTGVEAFLMGVPAISYRATVNEVYDNGFYRLPNAVSHQCFDFDQLKDMLHRILSGKLGAADGDDRKAMVDRYLSAQDGPLACERMVDVLETMISGDSQHSNVFTTDHLLRWAIARGYHLYRRLKPMLPGSHNKPDFQRHRYPGISIDDLNENIARIQSLLGDTTRVKTEKLDDVLFRISV